MQEKTERIEWYFEDFEIGREIVTPGRTLTEADIVNFAGVSGDFNPIHTDAEFSKTSVFGQRVSHGILGLAMASGLLTRLGIGGETVQAFLGLDWKFKAPIYIGDTIRVRARVAQTKAMPRLGGGIVALALEIVNQNGEKTQEGEWSVLIKSRSAPS